jgi:hypothetical protein
MNGSIGKWRAIREKLISDRALDVVRFRQTWKRSEPLDILTERLRCVGSAPLGLLLVED